MDRFRNGTRAALIAAAASLLVACGGSDDDDNGGADRVTAQEACTALSGKTIAGAAVSAAAAVPASGAVPTYCKVNATIAPSLNLELRLPDDWNGKLHYGGGGGYNGSIPGLGATNLNALQKGFATVSSDSGHQASGRDASFALNDTHAANLFGHLSVPTVMSSAQEMLRAAYGAAPSRNYFEGCSNGGREALVNAQRYPNLFDGIIARAPAYDWVAIMGAFNRNAKAVAATGGQFNAAEIGVLAQAVTNACDADDGIADGIVSNPAACSFDPAVLRCTGGSDTGDNCLSDAQLAVVQSWTTPAVFAAGAYRYPGWVLTGNEDEPGAWNSWLTGNGDLSTAAQFNFQDTTVKNYLARNPAADSLAYTPFDQNLNALYAMAALNSATNTDLRPFRDSGGKLILWHGGNDAALSHVATSEYYGGVVNTMGGQAAADAFVRYYIAPGVNHCSGGPGADSADLLAALDAWVEQNTAPGTLTASKLQDGAAVFTRPLCQYPQYPRYTGPANDATAAANAANYTCTSP